jgi:hypothetical protein
LYYGAAIVMSQKPALLCRAGATDKIDVTLVKKGWVLKSQLNSYGSAAVLYVYSTQPPNGEYVEVEITVRSK